MTKCILKGICVFLLLLTVVSVGVAQIVTGEDKPKASPSPSPTTKKPKVPKPPGTFEAVMANLKFRDIGPATMGGRVDDIEVVPSDSRIIYAAFAGGGILKSVNGGTTWETLFDKEMVPSVGDIAISPSNPSIIWAGSGEANNRQSSSWGNGIYKSLDAGKTWKNMGLAETHHIARIVVNPTNPDIVYVAATGKLWAASPERGVYKTTDGGKTWNLVLKVNDDTGASDLAIDPESPNILYATTYQRRRTVFGFNGSGEGSALYKSNDGGDSWKKITKGMPYDTEGVTKPYPDNLLQTGRSAIAVYPKDPNIVYALVEHANGGVYRSDDKGETWTRQSDMKGNPRPMYFSQIRVDPNNDQRLWVAGVTMQYSEDGGKTWTGNFAGSPHSDIHGIWIDPKDSSHLVIGGDGGINITYDRGKNWDFANTVPMGQFYEIGADNSMPYKICGGLQDNNAWCGPSMSFNPRGITNDDWYTIGGGDGFYAQPDPNDPNTVYTESQDGNLLRRNVVTGESKGIRPPEEEGEKDYRFQWNSPIVISAFDSKTIYYGGNFLFKSTDRGDDWTKISPDLTTGVDRNKLEIMGKVPDKNTRSRHDGVENFPAITTISESPLNANIIWAGTDDGNLQVTRDGKNWKNVVSKVPGLPKGTYVTRVVASRSGDGTAYATFDGHRMGDFKVYVYMTTDFGESWRSISSNLPENTGTVHVIREHPRNPNLLFVGTEFGIFASYDRGAKWTQMKQNFPTVPVDDILIHPRDNDLIVATHGRSIWIMDDITSLEKMNDSVMNSDVFLFDPRNAVMWRSWNNKPLTSDKAYYGENPPRGAIIDFYLREPLEGKESVHLTIQDASGQTAFSINCTAPSPTPTSAPAGRGGGFFGGGTTTCHAKQGINRFVWDLRSRPAGPQSGAPANDFASFMARRGLGVEPGEFTVKIKYGDTEMSKSLTVVEDPRVMFSAADRAKKRAAIVKLQPLVAQATTAQTTIVGLRTNVNNEIESWKKPGAPKVPDNVKKAAEDLLKKIDGIYINWGTPPSMVSTISEAGPPLFELPTPLSQRVTRLMFGIEGASTAPTAWEMAQIDILSAKIPPAAADVSNLVTVDLAALNTMMQEAKIPYIQPPTAGGGAGARRPPSDDDDDDEMLP